jgi:hypothetical protein
MRVPVAIGTSVPWRRDRVPYTVSTHDGKSWGITPSPASERRKTVPSDAVMTSGLAALAMAPPILALSVGGFAADQALRYARHLWLQEHGMLRRDHAPRRLGSIVSAFSPYTASKFTSSEHQVSESRFRATLFRADSWWRRTSHAEAPWEPPMSIVAMIRARPISLPLRSSR